MPIYQNGELKWPRPCFKDGAILVHRFGSGGWTRTNDLRVMSPTSCHCSTPRRISRQITADISEN